MVHLIMTQGKDNGSLAQRRDKRQGRLRKGPDDNPVGRETCQPATKKRSRGNLGQSQDKPRALNLCEDRKRDRPKHRDPAEERNWRPGKPRTYTVNQ